MKQFFKIILLLWGYAFQRNRNSKIIYYHDLDNRYTTMGTDFELFKQHIEIIRKNGYQIVPEILKDNNEVMICFDDGWAGIYKYKKYLFEQKIYPTIFIAVNLIGSDGHLSCEQIKELINMGFKFECHSWSHEDLTTFSEKELVHELIESKSELEKMFGKPFDAICYPKGRFSDEVFNVCVKAGYKKQYSSICGGYYDLNELGIICRNCVQFSSPFEFKIILNSTSSLFRKRYIKQQYKTSLHN